MGKATSATVCSRSAGESRPIGGSLRRRSACGEGADTGARARAGGFGICRLFVESFAGTSWNFAPFMEGIERMIAKPPRMGISNGEASTALQASQNAGGNVSQSGNGQGYAPPTLDSTNDLSPEARAIKEAIYQICPEIQDCIDNEPDVTDIDLDEQGGLWRKPIGQRYQLIRKIPPEVAQKIVLSFGSLRRHDYRQKSSLKTVWFGGHRVIFTYGEAVDAPIFHMRIKRYAEPNLMDMVGSGVMTENQAAMMVHAIKNHKNIIFCGLPGSGKTTIQIAVGQAYSQVPWLIIIVDPQREIALDCDNVRRVVPNAHYSEIDALDDALLRDPGAIGYGEVRLGASGVQLIRVWLTGTCGSFCTVHARDAYGVIPRFASFYRECGLDPVYEDLVQTIHYIVECEPYRDGETSKFRVARMLRVECQEFPESIQDIKYVEIP